MKIGVMLTKEEQAAIARKLDALVVEIDRAIGLGAGARASLARIRSMVLGETSSPAPRRRRRR
jgi:hypothetical protein